MAAVRLRSVRQRYAASNAGSNGSGPRRASSGWASAGDGHPEDGAEAARVVVADDRAVVEDEVDVVVRAALGGTLVDAQAAGHAEMHEQRVRADPEQ